MKPHVQLLCGFLSFTPNIFFIDRSSQWRVEKLVHEGDYYIVNTSQGKGGV